MDLQIAIELGQFGWKSGFLGVLLLDNGAEQSLSIKMSLCISKFIEEIFPLCLGDNQVVDIKFLHDVVELVAVDGFLAHAVDPEGFVELLELIAYDKMNAFLEVLPGLAGALDFQGAEVYVFPGHEIDELVDVDAVCGCPCESEDDLGFVLADVVPVLLDHVLQLGHSHLALLREPVEVLPDHSPVAVVLYEGALQLVQFEHVDVFAFEVVGDVRYLFVEVGREVDGGDGGLEVPLGLGCPAFGFGVPAQGLHFDVGAAEGVGGFWLKGVVGIGGGERLRGFVVAGVGFGVAGFEDVFCAEGEELFVTVGAAHLVDALRSELHDQQNYFGGIKQFSGNDDYIAEHRIDMRQKYSPFILFSLVRRAQQQLRIIISIFLIDQNIQMIQYLIFIGQQNWLLPRYYITNFSFTNIRCMQYILKILMRQMRVHSDKKQNKTFQSQMAYRSHSKQAINRIKQVYQSRRLYQPIITGVRIKTHSTSPAIPPHPYPHTQPNPSGNLRIKIPIKSRTPNTKSPIAISRRSPHKDHPLPLTSRPPQLEQLRRKHTDIKLNFKLNGTQKYFRRDKQKPNRVQNSSLNETLKMVWQMKPKRSSKIQFRMIRQLGKSQAGEIIQAASNITGMVAAIKTFRKNELKLQFLIDEIKIHLFCQHPNILPAYGYHIGKEEVYLVMEVGECNLYDKLIRHAPFDEPLVAYYISQVTAGVAYLHEAGVMHRDIKPENIICFGDCLKIADFGWSIRAARPRKTLCGTLDYLSPQVSKREYYNNKIDCWSIGVLMYELLTGQPPFPDQKDEVTTFQPVKMPKKLSAAGKDLLGRILEIDPVERLSAREILEHEWTVRNRRRYEEQKEERFAALVEEARKVLF